MLAFSKATYTKPVEGGGTNVPPQDTSPQNPASQQDTSVQDTPNQTM
jgi:hypothetical protein